MKTSKKKRDHPTSRGRAPRGTTEKQGDARFEPHIFSRRCPIRESTGEQAESKNFSLLSLFCRMIPR